LVAYRKDGHHVTYFDSFGNLQPPEEITNTSAKVALFNINIKPIKISTRTDADIYG